MTPRPLLLGILTLSLLATPAHAAEIDGAWRVTVSRPDRTVSGVASLRLLKGNAVMGWVGPSADDPIPVDGSFDGSVLTLHTHPQAGRRVAFADCKVTIAGDKMTGAIDGGAGAIEFVRDSAEKH